MEHDIIPIGDIVMRLFSNVDQTSVREGLSLLGAWNKILGTISGDGSKLTCHTKIVDFKNGNLLVEVDHSGWGQLLMMHKKYILNGIKMYVPQVKVRNILTRTRGQEFVLGEFSQDERNSDSAAKNSDVENSAHSEEAAKLPPELVRIFNDMKKSLLTNFEK